MADFTVFGNSLQSLEHRNERLGLRRNSLRADLLKERCTGTGIDFRFLLQADYVLFMRSELEKNGNFMCWWPETLIYLDHSNSTFEIFARSVSKTYFNKTKMLLSIEAPKDLEPLLKSYQDNQRSLPKWNFKTINPAKLLGYEHLATRP
jgi:hypothetical protein